MKIKVFGVEYECLSYRTSDEKGCWHQMVVKGSDNGRRIIQEAILPDDGTDTETWEWGGAEKLEEEPEPQIDERERTIRIMAGEITELKRLSREWALRFDRLLDTTSRLFSKCMEFAEREIQAKKEK